MITLYAEPARTPVTLTVRPALESWDAAGSPGRLRLAEHLDSAERQVGGAVLAGGRPLALSLAVGLPERQSATTGGHDLDNYLLPPARRFGAHRFDAVFGRKRIGPHSTLAVGPTTPLTACPEPSLRVETSVSAASTAWKEQIRTACAEVVTGPFAEGGALRLTIAFGVSSHRNRSTLWKPAIDALGPVLGLPVATRRYQPLDDRIVELALHRTVDDSLGHDVRLAYWWAEAEACTEAGTEDGRDPGEVSPSAADGR